MSYFRTALLLAVLTLTGCDRLRQVRSYADLQVIVRSVKIHQSGVPTGETLRAAIHVASEDGLDGWGNPFVFFIRGQHWVVLSTGSDGALDFEPEAAYFELEPEDIRGEAHRDIVFRDEKNITYGGT